MRLSPGQLQLASTILRNAFAEAGAPETSIDTTGLIDRDAFFQAVDRATRDAADATELARKLTTWATRLHPYFERNPALSLQAAVDAYKRDRDERPSD